MLLNVQGIKVTNSYMFKLSYRISQKLCIDFSQSVISAVT